MRNYLFTLHDSKAGCILIYWIIAEDDKTAIERLKTCFKTSFHDNCPDDYKYADLGFSASTRRMHKHLATIR